MASIEKVRTEEVKTREGRYSCSYPLHLPALEESMRRMGQLQPVTLVPREGALVVVSGLRRVAAAKKLGLDRVQAFILDQTPSRESLLFVRNLEDNLASRNVNLFERALAVKRWVKDFKEGPPEPGDADCLGLLGLSWQPRTVEIHLALEGLDEEVKRFVLERGLPEKTAILLTGLKDRAARILTDLAQRLKLTASQVRETAVLTREIGLRDGVPVPQVIQDLTGKATDLDEGDEPARRLGFMEALRKARFPEYSLLKKKMEACLGPINAPAGIRVKPPPYLEGDAFVAEITFHSARDLIERAETLLRIAGQGGLDRAAALLGEE